MGLNYYNQQFESLKKEIHFLKEKNINETFIEAVTQGDINKIDLLLDENEDENEETLVNFTDTIDVNTRNKNGDTALIIASDNDNLEAVKLLLEYQADVSLKDVNGDNALIRAARKGHFDVVEELLYQKTNINSTGQHKITALMAAAENGYLRVVKLLIKKGAKISIKNNYDKTALDIVNEKIINLNHNTNSNYYLIKNVLECQSKQLELPFNGEMPNLFNIWEVILDKNYEKDFKEWEKNDPIIYDKIKLLMKHIEYDPFRGLGRVERLTGNLEGLYSRRINKQNRLVYDIDGEKVLLQSCKGHYKREKRKNTRSRHNSKK